MTRQVDVQKSMNNVSGGDRAEKTSNVRGYDEAAVQKRMADLHAEIAQKKAAEAKREQELAAVEVAAADISLLADQLGVSEAVAARKLKEKSGDVTAVLRETLQLPKSRA